MLPLAETSGLTRHPLPSAPSVGEGGEGRPLNATPLSPEMKLQAVMENLHRQQRAKLLMEQQLQQQAATQQTQAHARGGVGGDEPMGSPAPEAEQTQMAALAAMRAAAAGLQRVSDSPMSERSSGGEQEEEDDDDEGEDRYKDMMGSEEEEQM